jgi:hypothetical protein
MHDSPPSLRTAAALAAFACSAVMALAQAAPTVHVAFRAGAADTGPLAFQRLRAAWLPSQPAWPAELQPGAAFSLTLVDGALRIAPSTSELPEAVVAMASLQFDDGPAAVGSCTADGTEDWFVPDGFTLPTPWQRRLRELQADLLDQPRCVDAAVLAGHLAGPLVDGAPRAQLAHLAALCGEVTFVAWRADGRLRVRGRSDGGLLLPALIVAALDRDGTATLPLRAFAARDGDRAEAARQLLRLDGDQATRALRGLLHADDELRLAAIDAMVRRGATDELPRIVAAAAPGLPLATTAATDALRALWLDAPPDVRQRTRAALARSDNPDLRRIDLERLPHRVADTPAAPAADPGPRLRTLVLLLLSGACLYGIWLRQRAHQRTGQDHAAGA